LRIALAVAVLFAVLGPVSACSGAADAPPSDPGRLAVVADGETHVFQVEIADDEDEQRRGLMFRRELADDAGMLFLYAEPRRAAMWMKNTFIPLDILFIREDGEIVRIHHMAEPHDLTALPSGEVVAAALEIRGGRAAELGIEEGDRVLHASLKTRAR